MTTMGLAGYRSVFAARDARRVLLLGTVIRVPLWAGNVVVTLHVVTHLHRSYGEAGVAAAVATVALAISSPWRGRRLDAVGLRRSILPSLAVLAVCWSIAPFHGYWVLVVVAGVANLFTVPTFSLVRQALMHAVDDTHRRAALAIDSVFVEVSFMIGPALGVLLATYVPTPWALFTCEFSVLAGGLLVCIVNPTLRSDTGTPAATAGRAAARRSLLGGPVVAVLVMSMAATIVLTGTDVGVVAALRGLHHQSWIGWQLAVWGFGSAVGGLIYGALHRSVPLVVLLCLLAATTLPVTLATDAATIGVLLFVAGLFCAPTITASIDALTSLVAERARGEALGWHGAALTVGGAVGAPVAGFTIDVWGWRGAFTTCALLALVTAAVGAALLRRGSPVRADGAAGRHEPGVTVG